MLQGGLFSTHGLRKTELDLLWLSLNCEVYERISKVVSN